MRVFYHVDDFGQVGMGHIPYLTCVSNPLVVWAPAPRLLMKARSAGQTFLSASGLLDLVQHKEHPVRIIGRAEWLLDKRYRNCHPFPLAGWVDKFDDAIRAMALEDVGMRVEERRIIIAPPEEGNKKAEERMEEPGANNIARHLRRLFTDSKLPPGMLDKAKRARDRRHSVPKVILRDLFNHSDAIGLASAKTAATPCEHMLALKEILPEAPFEIGPPSGRRGNATAQDILEAFEVVEALKPRMLQDEKGLREFLGSKHRKALLHVLYSNWGGLPLASWLAEEIRRGMKAYPFWQRIVSPGRIEPLMGVVDFVHLVARTVLGVEPGWGWARMVVRPLTNLAERLGVLPAAYRGRKELKGLFYLVHGKVGITRPEILRLIERLRKM